MTVLVKIEKYFLIITNIIFTVLALISTGFGVILLYRMSHAENKLFALSPALDFIPKTIVVTGIVMAVFYFLGFWGACREKQFLLQLYAAIMLIIVLLMGCGIIFTAFSHTAHNETSSLEPTPYDIAFKHYGVPGENISTLFVDAVQYKFHCCGYRSPQEMNYNGIYPQTCCGLEEDICHTPLYDTGCYYKLKESGSSIMCGAKITSYIIFIIEILCMVAAFHFSSAISNKKTAPPAYLNFA